MSTRSFSSLVNLHKAISSRFMRWVSVVRYESSSRNNREIQRIFFITKALSKFLLSFSTSSHFGNRRMSSHSASSFFYFVRGWSGEARMGASYVGRICNSFTNLHTKKIFFIIFGAREKDFFGCKGREKRVEGETLDCRWETQECIEKGNDLFRRQLPKLFSAKQLINLFSKRSDLWKVLFTGKSCFSCERCRGLKAEIVMRSFKCLKANSSFLSLSLRLCSSNSRRQLLNVHFQIIWLRAENTFPSIFHQQHQQQVNVSNYFTSVAKCLVGSIYTLQKQPWHRGD